MIFSRQITQFVSLVRHGSYTRAAEAISVTPSALSHGINELEERIGKKLIIRNKSGTKLTRVGHDFYKDIEHIYDKGLDTYKRFKTRSNSENIVCCVDSFFYHRFHDKICMLVEMSKSKINIQEYNPTLINEWLQDEKVDLALRVDVMPMQSINPGLCHISLSQLEVVIAVEKNLNSKFSSVYDLLQHTCLFQTFSNLEHPALNSFKEMLSFHNIEASIIELPEYKDVFSIVRNGLGISLITEDMMQNPELNNNQIITLPLPPPLKINLNKGILFKESRYNELFEIIQCVKG